MKPRAQWGGEWDFPRSIIHSCNILWVTEAKFLGVTKLCMTSDIEIKANIFLSRLQGADMSKTAKNNGALTSSLVLTRVYLLTGTAQRSRPISSARMHSPNPNDSGQALDSPTLTRRTDHRQLKSMAA